MKAHEARFKADTKRDGQYIENDMKCCDKKDCKGKHHKKLNGLSIDVQEKIKGASIEGLELLQSHIFDIESGEDIERLLMNAHTL